MSEVRHTTLWTVDPDCFVRRACARPDTDVIVRRIIPRFVDDAEAGAVIVRTRLPNGAVQLIEFKPTIIGFVDLEALRVAGRDGPEGVVAGVRATGIGRRAQALRIDDELFFAKGTKAR